MAESQEVANTQVRKELAKLLKKFAVKYSGANAEGGATVKGWVSAIVRAIDAACDIGVRLKVEESIRTSKLVIQSGELSSLDTLLMVAALRETLSGSAQTQFELYAEQMQNATSVEEFNKGLWKILRVQATALEMRMETMVWSFGAGETWEEQTTRLAARTSQWRSNAKALEVEILDRQLIKRIFVGLPEQLQKNKVFGDGNQWEGFVERAQERARFLDISKKPFVAVNAVAEISQQKQLRKCYLCGQVGHIKWQCRLRCRECSQVAHQVSKCPKMRKTSSKVKSADNGKQEDTAYVRSAQVENEVLCEMQGFTQVRVAGTRIMALMDSGAGVSCLHADFAIRQGLKVEPTSEQFLGANQKPLEVVGFAWADTTLLGKTSAARYLVVRALSVPMIFGRELLSKWKISLSFDNSGMWAKRKNGHSKREPQRLQEEARMGAQVDDQMKLKADQLSYVQMRTHASVNGVAMFSRHDANLGLVDSIVEVVNGRFVLEAIGWQKMKLPEAKIVGHVSLLPTRTAVSILQAYQPSTTDQQLLEETWEQSDEDKGARMMKEPTSAEFREWIRSVTEDLEGRKVGTSKSRKRVIDLLQAKKEIFTSRPGSRLVGVKPHEMVVEGLPSVAPRYRYSHRDRLILDSTVEKLLREKKCRPSNSPWASNLIVVWRENAKPRVCIDLRHVNARMTVPQHPTPHIAMCLDEVGGSTMFSTLDLESAYQQVPLSEESAQFAAFRTSKGLMEPTTMVFGEASAPGSFQQYMRGMLAEMDTFATIIYLDDVIIHTKNIEEHIVQLTRLLSIFEKHNVKIRPTKCHFLQSEVKMLGHIVSAQGIRPDPERVKAVQAMILPSDAGMLKSWIGTVNQFSRFMPNTAALMYPMGKQQAQRSARWKGPRTLAFLASFAATKAAIKKITLNVYPRVDGNFVVTADASEVAIGGTLAQTNKTSGELDVVAHFSRKLKLHERGYSATERELLALVAACKNWRHYLHGTRTILVSDHKPIEGLLKKKSLSGRRIQRWQAELMEFSTHFRHVAGSKIGIADSLSRLIATLSPRVNPSYTTTGALRIAQRKDEYCQRITRAWFRKERCIREKFTVDELNTLYRRTEQGLRIVLAKRLVPTVLSELHGGRCSGHGGRSALFQRVQKFVWFQKMFKAMTEWVASCESCQMWKHINVPGGNQKPLMAGFPLDVVAIDHVTMPMARGYKYLLTAIDINSSYFWAIPVKTESANEVMEVLQREIVNRFGAPAQIFADQGAAFMSTDFDEWCRETTGESVNLSPAYHRQSNGRVERHHRTLKSYLRTYLNEKGGDWLEHLDDALISIRTQVNPFSGHTSFFLMHGFEFVSPLERKLGVRYGPRDPEKRRGRQRLAILDAREKRLKKWKNSKFSAQELLSYKAGEMVKIKNEHFSGSKFLARQWLGPYRVMQQLGGDLYEVETVGIRKSNLLHSSQMRPFIPREPILASYQLTEEKLADHVSQTLSEGKPEKNLSWVKKNGSNEKPGFSQETSISTCEEGNDEKQGGKEGREEAESEEKREQKTESEKESEKEKGEEGDSQESEQSSEGEQEEALPTRTDQPRVRRSSRLEEKEQLRRMEEAAEDGRSRRRGRPPGDGWAMDLFDFRPEDDVWVELNP